VELFTLAIANMIIRKDGKSNIYHGDCFDKKIVNELKEKNINIGLINPPYSQNDVCELEFDDDLKPVKEMKNYGVFSDTETIYNGVIPKIIGITPDGEVEGVDNILIKCIKGGING
jgi:hypothetical protein